MTSPARAARWRPSRRRTARNRDRRPAPDRGRGARSRRAASAGTAARERPVASASSATAPIAAARTTLGLGRASTTKATSAEACDDGLDPPVGGPPAQRPQHAREDDRDVGAGHGGEVAEARPAELLGQDRIHRAGVADRQTRQQAGRAGLEHACGGRGQTVPHRSRGPLDRSGPAERRRRTRAARTATSGSPSAAVRHRRVRAPAGPGSSSAQSSAGANNRTASSTRCRRSPTTTSVTVASATTARSRAGEQVRIAVQFEDHRHRATRVGDRPQRRRLPHQAADTAADARHGEPGQHADQQRRPPVRTVDQRRPDRGSEHTGDDQHQAINVLIEDSIRRRHGAIKRNQFRRQPRAIEALLGSGTSSRAQTCA